MEHQLCKPQKLCSICWRVLCLLWSSVKDARKTKSWRGSKQSVQLSLELAVEMSMSTMAAIWVSFICLGSIFPQRVLGIDLSFSILASFWLHGLHFTVCSCSSWNAASCFISTCTSSSSSTLAVDSFNWLPVELSGTQPLERGNWRCRHCLDKTQMVWHQFHTLNFLSLLCSSSHLCCNWEQTISLYIHGPVMKRSSKWWNKDERTQQAVLLVKSLLFT